MKIRKCEVCRRYTLKLYHCGKMTLKANPANFKEKYIKVIYDS
ncbi:MAG: hypothetical protein GXN92_01110 [Candidatus Micrarchaeota archaeon]|nr:hypothetical protein [Candidatus Micrarchaeota archaeon]